MRLFLQMNKPQYVSDIVVVCKMSANVGLHLLCHVSLFGAIEVRIVLV